MHFVWASCFWSEEDMVFVHDVRRSGRKERGKGKSEAMGVVGACTCVVVENKRKEGMVKDKDEVMITTIEFF